MESSLLAPVAPVRPVAPYIGGKRNLAKRIVARINAVPHTIYAEPFVGMGGIFLRRDRRPPSEIVNDVSGDVVTLFRVLQRHYPYFIDMLRWRLTSRHEFERLAAEDATTLTDLERAAQFLYLQRIAFGGRVVGRSFGVSPGLGARFNVTQLEPMLADLHARLAGVVIERLGWEAFLDRYDRPGALFYLDPPYRGSEGSYGAELFAEDAFARMAERLARLRGRFLLSINDDAVIRGLFGGFEIEAVDVSYTVGGGGKGVRRGELIVSGGGS